MSWKFDYANLSCTVVFGKTDVYINFVAEEDSGRILGGHIVGAEDSSLIHEVVTAMAGDVSVSDVGNTLHAYPTLSEGVCYACQAAR